MIELTPISPPYFGLLRLSDETGTDKKKELLADLSFRDSNNLVWRALNGGRTDGASVPWFLWQELGEPFAPPQVFAAVIHDAACMDIRCRYAKSEFNWDEVCSRRKMADEMIYEACLGARMSPRMAKLYYLGVRIGACFGVGMPDILHCVPDSLGLVPRMVAYQGGMPLNDVSAAASAPGNQGFETARRQHDLADQILRRRGGQTDPVVFRNAGVLHAEQRFSGDSGLKEAVGLEIYNNSKLRLSSNLEQTISEIDGHLVDVMRMHLENLGS